MTIMIQLPNVVEKHLREAAIKQQVSPEALAAQILEEALVGEIFPTLEEVIAKIKALPPNPHAIRPATASLKELLENAPVDPDFDLEAWQREWAKVEKEMKAITRANAIAEGLY